MTPAQQLVLLTLLPVRLEFVIIFVRRLWDGHQRRVEHVEDLHGGEEETHLILPAGEVGAVEAIQLDEVLAHHFQTRNRRLGSHSTRYYKIVR